MNAYPSERDGALSPEGLRRACGHVWRDSNSTTMLGSNILNAEPVSYDDKQALQALKRHISASGPRAFLEDVLPKLGFGPPHDDSPDASETITCEKCGKDAVPLHLGCRLCEDCCDCRPRDAS